MKIGLHDADKTKFPNLALMKLATWHINQGDEIEFYNRFSKYNVIYSSKVFTFTKDEYPLPDSAFCGGVGHEDNIAKQEVLRDSVEHSIPFYPLYNLDYSVGFLTRGCPNKCSWCVVPSKEGEIRKHADIEEFLAHKEVVLMDNNVLAHSHGIDQIDKMAKLGIKVDFNQGLDARLIDGSIARRLAKLKWRAPLRMACDSMSQMKHIHKAVQLLRYNNCTPTRFFVYVLVKDIDDALERVKFIKGLGLDPFAQPYRDFKENIEPSNVQKAFARWVNHKAIFKTVTWEEYKIKKGLN